MSRIHGVRQILAGTISNASVASDAAIADTKLDTISSVGKVSNSATSATTNATASTIVLRDGAGKFSIGSVTGILAPANGGTGVDNGTKTITLGGNLQTSGAFSTEFVQQANVSLTLPDVDGVLATQDYVDSVAQGLDVKGSVRAATTAALPANTYDGGGKFLEADANGALADQDGVTLIVGDRLLVKDEVDAANNGIYVVSVVGDAGTPWKLTRATDFDGTPANEVSGGAFCFVEEGTQFADMGFVVVSDGILAVGTDDINFTQFSGAGQVLAGAGLSKSGNTLYISNTGVAAGTYNSVTVNVRGQVTAANAYTTLTTAGLSGVLSNLTDVTSTAAEVNELHGAAATQADFIKLHAITRTAADINDLATLTELASTASGDGASLIGVNPISGLTGSDVQTCLGSLNTRVIDLESGVSGMVDYEFIGNGDGSTIEFTVAANAYVAGSLRVFVNGLLMRKGAGAGEASEYNPATGKFRFGTAPAADDEIIVCYR